MPDNTPQERGLQAEQQACEFLQQQGFRLIEKNFSCRLGELDLIMLQDTKLIFVEVKYRTGTQYGYASEAVDHRKQQKIIRSAEYFLQQHPQLAEMQCRFDVISFTGPGLQIEWLPDAFSSTF
ncbi:MAG: YraN family protein [Gammaproteobacteria bacterium]|nr:YraN family protein [Gammaproteobacteria bacterium]